MTIPGAVLLASSPSPSQAELQDQRRRMNQQPAITGAQETADAGLSQPPVGSGMDWYGAAEPEDGKWLICDGRIFLQELYPDLYAVIGTTFNDIGDAAGTFRIPDRRGRTAIGAGLGPGLTDRARGSKIGVEEHAITIGQMPSHHHGGLVSLSSHHHGGATGSVTHNHLGDTYVSALQTTTGVLLSGGGTSVVVNGVTQKNDGAVDGVTIAHPIAQHTHDHGIELQGGGLAHPNMQPSLTVNTIIRAVR